MHLFTRKISPVFVILLALFIVQLMGSCVLAVDNINDLNRAYDQQEAAAGGGTNFWLDLLKLIIILLLILGAAWSVIRFLG
ncbi:hypothetical protein [Syntrophomonas palmitatica]|uniref:hypothetical protein n=1 Tax=Syntrophomonas palmitatica TaxID=402877 RepID=UPI0006D00D49|nr:hypothetical protein [Syntrophomonas palmitatica]